YELVRYLIQREIIGRQVMTNVAHIAQFYNQIATDFPLNAQIVLIGNGSDLLRIEERDCRIRPLSKRYGSESGGQWQTGNDGKPILQSKDTLRCCIRHGIARRCGEAKGRRVPNRVTNGRSIENTRSSANERASAAWKAIGKSQSWPKIVGVRG